MARYSRRRGGGMRRTRRKRGYGKTSRRSRTRTGMTIRRSAKSFRRSRTIAGKTRRWKKYYFSRMIDLELKNTDPATGLPQTNFNSFSCPLPVVGNMISPVVADTTAPVADHCSNFSFSHIFKMDNLPNVGEFVSTSAPPAGLFEEYKLAKICLEIIPTYQGKDIIKSTLSPSLVGVDDFKTENWSFPTPTLYYIQDYDNINSINWPMICEMGGVQRLKLDRPHKIWIKPAVVMPVAASLTGPSVFSTTKKSVWITNKNLTIPHFGLRMFVQDWPGPSDETSTVVPPTESDQVSYSVRFNLRYYFTLRGTM